MKYISNGADFLYFDKNNIGPFVLEGFQEFHTSSDTRARIQPRYLYNTDVCFISLDALLDLIEKKKNIPSFNSTNSYSYVFLKIEGSIQLTDSFNEPSLLCSPEINESLYLQMKKMNNHETHSDKALLFQLSEKHQLGKDFVLLKMLKDYAAYTVALVYQNTQSPKKTAIILVDLKAK